MLRIVNPETGREVVGPGTGHKVELSGLGLVTVKITPSIRPSLPYDLSTYPISWVVEA